MERILTRICTAEQSGLLMRNAWRYAHIGSAHVRIHPPTCDISVLPGAVRHVASIELLDAEIAPWGRAEQDAVDAVVAVFGSALPNGQNDPILPGIGRHDSEPANQGGPISDATEVIQQPDWNSQSDKEFLEAAKATFRQHASLLRRLA